MLSLLCLTAFAETNLWYNDQARPGTTLFAQGLSPIQAVASVRSTNTLAEDANMAENFIKDLPQAQDLKENLTIQRGGFLVTAFKYVEDSQRILLKFGKDAKNTISCVINKTVQKAEKVA